MALPNQSIAMGDLERETAATLVGSKRFVMFDESEGKSASLEDIKDHILGDIDDTIELQDRAIQNINLKLGNFADELEVDEEGLVYLLNNGERIAGPYGPFAGGGGGGGGGSNNAILTLLNTSGWLSKTIAEGASCPISFTWSSTENDIPTGNGVLTVKVNNSTRINRTISQGAIEIDVKDYLTSGQNSIRVTVSDIYNNTKFINYTVSVITLSITSVFDATIPRTGSFTFNYTPIGNVAKTVYFVLDNEVIGTEVTSVSNRQLGYTIPARSHGAHSLLVYFETEVDGETIRSNELYYEIMYITSGDDTPIITSNFRETTTKQYTTLPISYMVYTPNNTLSRVEIYVNDVLKSTQNVERVETIWSYRADTVGEVTIRIQTGTIYKEFNLTVTESEVMARITTEDMVLGLEATGRSNAEANPGTWVYENISCIFQNFNYVSNGWVLDDEGNTVLRISGKARLIIPYQPCADNFLETGKTIEIDFATHNVLNYDATILSCMHENRGFLLTAQQAMLKSEQSEVSTQYKEEEHVRISFVAEKDRENRLLYIYINGIMSGVVQYADKDNFNQLVPQNIVIGSDDCTTDIYSIRIYNNDLTRHQILENWIADTQNVDTMLRRYEHNNVYNEYGAVVVDKLPNDLPYMILSTSLLPQFKGDKIKHVEGTYVDPSNPSLSFTFTEATVDVQGTSSQFYARKNYKIKFEGGFDITQSGEHVSKYAINNGIPVKTFTFKADVASSEGANNVELVRLYNEVCPYKTPPQNTNSKVRQGIDGFPIVMFWDNGESVSFLGKYNWNNDKGTEEVFGFTEGDESWETLNNAGTYALWKNADYTTYTTDEYGRIHYDWESDYEARYPDPDDAPQDPTNLSALAAWLVSTNQDTATNTPLAESYTDSKGVVHTIDNAAYRLAKFRTEAPDHFEMDSLLFMYLFTELFLMVDSRAKNAFPSFLGGDKWCFLPYDMDTAIGIDNRGELTFGYSLEDIDYIGTMAVFNGQDSVLWINVRDAFGPELEQMYQQVRGNGNNQLSYQKIEKMFEDHQAKWPEAIFNEDSWFKYIDPLLENGNGDYLPMALGSKAEQRKWWLYNRFRYIDSKYNAGDTKSDTISIRPGAIPEDVSKRGIEITPYADIYAGVLWDVSVNSLIKKRATHGTSVFIPFPYEQVGDNVVEILNASQLASVGDLSGFKPHRASFANATRLQYVKVGSDEDGYTNPNLKDLTFGNNSLLKIVDARNCTALGGNIDLSGATNIEEIYLDGTIIQGVTLPNGGVLKKLHLPSTIANLTILNHSNIEELSIASYDNITTLRLENIPSNYMWNALNQIKPNTQIRLIGFTWNVANATEVESILNKLDTMRGIDNTSTSQQIQGTINVNGELSGAQLASYHNRYPYITVVPTRGTCVVTYLKADGGVAEQEEVDYGMNADYNEKPEKPSTAQYSYEWIGWSEKNNNIVDPHAQDYITMDKTLYPCYRQIINSYTVYFVRDNEDGGGILYTQENVPYGEIPVYSGATPTTDKGDAETWPFYGWTPVLSPVVGNTTYTAVFRDTSPITRQLIGRRLLDASGMVSCVGSYAFGYCHKLDTISFSTVTHISNSAFYECYSLATINLPNVTSIGTNAFAYCNALKNITFTKVTSMGSNAFAECEMLTSVNFPLLEAVPQSAFMGCDNLKTVDIPNASIIHPYGFYNCGLSSIELSNVTIIGSYAFYYCSLLQSINFSKVENVNYGAFANCDRLSNIQLSSLKTISDTAFMSCTDLMSVSFSRLQTIGQNAFASCPNLIMVRFSNVTTIGSSAFANCRNLRSVYFLMSSKPSLANNVFEGTPIDPAYQGVPGSIYVPTSMVSDYQRTTAWLPYRDRIVPYEF